MLITDQFSLKSSTFKIIQYNQFIVKAKYISIYSEFAIESADYS